jgi:hypothetical protein
MGRQWNICPRCGALAKLRPDGRMGCQRYYDCMYVWRSRSVVVVAKIKRRNAAKAAEGGAK